MTKFDIDAYVNKVFPEGTKILVTTEVGVVGCTGHDFYVLQQDYTQGQLDDIMWDLAVSHAESYGYYPESYRDDSEDWDEDDNGGDQYTDNIEGSFEIYNPEEHDGYMIGSRGTPYFNKL